jgi:hypothetical protein
VIAGSVCAIISLDKKPAKRAQVKNSFFMRCVCLIGMTKA